ncbi:MAG: amino acid adenylation domain-containing protein, partial [Acidobacteriota bacterium]
DLDRLAQTHSATRFMMLLAGLAALLERQSGSPDVVIGTPVAGRTHASMGRVVGLFLNTLALRLDLADRPSAETLIARARDAALDAFDHQTVPFERLLAELQLARDTARTSLFSVFLNVLNLPDSRRPFGDLARVPLAQEANHANFDWNLYVQPSGPEGLRILWVVDARRFSTARIEATQAQLQTLFEAMVAAPTRSLARVALDRGASRPAALDPTRPLTTPWRGSCIDLILQCPASRVAVVDGQNTWTYSDLIGRVERLAGVLADHGVGRGDRVAVYAHRSAPLAVALLGVLRAGAAFVVLDPAYPSARLAQIVAIARPQAVVALDAAGALPDSLRALDAPQLRLDPNGRTRLADGARPQPSTPPALEPRLQPTDLAYLAFTSGSTGVPKGVRGHHGALGTYAAVQAARFDLGASDRFSVMSALAHDPLHRDLLTPLILGATAAMPDGERLGEPGYLASWMAAEGITVANMTPALARVIAAAPPAAGATAEDDAAAAPAAHVPTLRRIFLVGDVLTDADAAALIALGPSVEVINSYGATETSRGLGYHVAGIDEPHPTLPLGQGVGDAQLLIVGPHGALAGVGELGEVVMRSPHLAQGYADDPALTALRFAPDPFGADPAGGRVYRTGDLGRFTPEGAVRFAGRVDFQVQVRGFRVELGEIQAALQAHPAVGDAVVVVRDGADLGLAADAGPALVAYSEPPAGQRAHASADELRAHLRDRLPVSAIPAAFETLDALPRTPTGKVDRTRLPAPARLARAVHTAPRTREEHVIAAIWGDLLGGDRFDVHEDFFALGGHSLLATRVLAQLRARLEVDVPLRAFFDAPTIAGLARTVVQTGRAVQLPLPTRQAGDGPFPLSAAQARLWFLRQLDPQNAGYHMPVILAVEGALDPARLARATRAVVDRHAALRSSITEDALGRPQQAIVDAATLTPAFVFIDLRRGDDDAAPSRAVDDPAVQRAFGRVIRRPFDLARDPMLRIAQIALADAHHVLVVVQHHIASDGWSAGLILRDLTAAYRDPRSLPPAPTLRAADVAVWEHSHRSDAAMADDLTWWQTTLRDVPPLDLPFDRSRPARPRGRGGEITTRLARGLAEPLRALEQRSGATPYMILLAAFHTVLGRFAGQRDLATGTPVANRGDAEALESIVGLFVNAVAIRADLNGAPSFDALVARTRDRVLGAFERQHVPFDRLVDHLDLPRDVSHPPIFQVLFALHNQPRTPMQGLDGVTVRSLPRVAKAARYDLTLNVWRAPQLDAAGDAHDGIAALEYDADLFDRATARRILSAFETLLAAALDAPATPIAALPLMPSALRVQTLQTWNDTAAALAPADAPTTLDGRIAAQAQRAPQAIAVTEADGTAPALSYAALLREADRLADRLRGLGVGPETRVPILIERSRALIVALLATLRAGAAYVPLDPGYPPARLAHMLDDAGRGQAARVALVAPTALAPLADDLADALAPYRAIAVRFADDADVLAGLDALPSRADADARDDLRDDPRRAAYAIYTSGSTGRPKGTINAHAGVVNRIDWMQRAFPLGADDRVLQKTPASFDVSVWEFFWPLMVGARLVLAAPEGHRDPAYLAATIRAQDITTLHFVPSMLALFLDEPDLASLSSLRRVMASGEALPASLVERFGASLPSTARLHNLYGPTEAAIDVTWWPCPPAGEALPASGVPIGGPIANVRTYVVAPASLEAQPPGVAGELLLGGVQVGRGYLHRPALTAERFVPDPFAEAFDPAIDAGAPGGRLYRTGDRVAWSADGQLRYLGRFDHQVKVRGVRVELGEIEAALAALPDVREALILAVPAIDGDDDPGGLTLLGFAVATAGAALDDGALRAALRASLPEAYVPSRVLVLDELPLTPSGKADRKALRARSAAQPIAPTPAAPAAPAEPIAAPTPSAASAPSPARASTLLRAVQALWAEVLELPASSIDPTVSFFDLGGHSLKLVQVQRLVRSRFGVALSLVDMFQRPTIATLAAHLAEAGVAVEPA